MTDDFDERAATWDDDPAKVERGRHVAAAVRGAVVVEASTSVLEYGAGTGLTSQSLGAVGSLTLADPSEGMRTVMAAKRDAGAFPRGTRIWDLDLTDADAPDETFDLIVTVMALHHIPAIDTVLRGFAALLVEGGHVCIVDLEEDPDGSFHSTSPHFDGHHGFRRSDLTARLTGSGFDDVRFEHCLDVEKDGTAYPLFLATAVRRPRT
jgi:SAM-dependent methyltransferase